MINGHFFLRGSLQTFISKLVELRLSLPSNYYII